MHRSARTLTTAPRNGRLVVAQIVRRELLDTFSSIRFVVIFGACTGLVLLSIIFGTQEFRASVRQYEVATSVMRNTVDRQVSYQALGMWGAYKIYKRPPALAALVQGLDGTLGRSTVMSIFEAPRLRDPRNSDEPIYAVFGTLDLFSVSSVVLSLFAMLFTFDAISGERERGTLKLMLAGPVPRDAFILGKLIGSLLGLVLPVLVPLVLGVLIMTWMPGVDFVADDWIRLGVFLGLTLVYITVFLALGLCVSACTSRSAISFLVLLVVWVALVWVVPRASVMVASALVPVQTPAEAEAAKGELDREWYRESRLAQERWLREHPGQATVPEDVQGRLNGQIADRVTLGKRRIDEDYLSAQRRRMAVAQWLARLSPTGAYALASMALAQTDVNRQEQFLRATMEYRRQFQDYVGAKMREERRAEALGQMRRQPGLDVSDMPAFVFHEERVGQTLHRVWVDVGTLLLSAVLLYASTFVAFLRYDVRS